MNRRTFSFNGSGLRGQAFRTGAELLLAVTVGALSACGDAADHPEADAPSANGSSAAAALVPASDVAGHCVDAGVVPEGGEAPPEATAARRRACTVNLVRRGEPLTIEYQIK